MFKQRQRPESTVFSGLIDSIQERVFENCGAGDIVTWEGLRALALGSCPYFLDRESNSLVGLGELTDIFFSE